MGEVEKGQNATEAFQNIGQKIIQLLEKTRESILADFKNETTDILLFSDDKDKLAKTTESFGSSTKEMIKLIDLIFAKMGLDFSDATNLKAFGNRLVSTIEKIEKLASILAKAVDATKSDSDDSKQKALEIIMKMIPLIQELFDAVKDFSLDEMEKIGKEVNGKFDDFDVKAIIKKVVEYTVMSLLKNAKEVFADEIEFVELKVQLAKDTLNEFKSEIQAQIKTVKEELDKQGKEIQQQVNQAKEDAQQRINQIQDEAKDAFDTIVKPFSEMSDLSAIEKELSSLTDETRKRAAELYLKLTEGKDKAEDALERFFDDNADTFAKIARAFNITYSILDFVGIVQHKQYTLTVPDEIVAALRSAKDSVAGVLGNADSKVVAIASGINDKVEAFGATVAGKVEGAASDAANKVRDGYGDAIGALKDSASKVDSTATDIANDQINFVNSVHYEVSQLSSTLGISQASIQTVELQLATMAVNKADEKLTGAAKDAQAAITKKYGDIKSTIQDIYSGKVTDIQAAYAKIKNCAAEINSKADSVLDQIDNFSYTINYITLDWGKIKTLFTQPVKHFKQLYPIDSVDDAKALASRFMDILHLINPNIPTFDNLLKMLESLLKKLKDRLMRYVGELKNKLQDGMDELRKKAINFLKPLVDKVQAIIDFIKSLARQLKEEMMQVIENMKVVMKSVGKNFETLGYGFYRQLMLLKEEAEGKVSDIQGEIEKAVKDAEKQIASVKDAIVDAAEEVKTATRSVAAKPAQAVKEAKAEAVQAFMEAKAEMEAHYNKLVDGVQDVARDIKNEAGKSVADAKKALEEKLSGFAGGFGAELLQIVVDTPITVPSLKGFSFDTSVVQPALAGFLSIDIDTDFDLASLGDDAKNFTKAFEDVKRKITTTFNDISKKSRTDIAEWAESVGASIMTVVNPGVWKDRLDSVLSQLEVEFNGDMATLKSLVSVEGAKSIVTDFGAVKKNLADNIDINSYINIVKTAVTDVVLPNPELYYDTFKDVVKNILTYIKDEIDKLIKGLGDQFKDASKAVKDRYNDIKSKLESTLENLKSAFEEKKNQAKEIGELLKKMIEDMATEMWKRIKGELISPLIDSLKAYITEVARRVIRLTVQKIVNELMAKVYPQIQQAVATATKTVEEVADKAKEAINNAANEIKGALGAAANEVTTALRSATNGATAALSAAGITPENAAAVLSAAENLSKNKDKALSDIKKAVENGVKSYAEAKAKELAAGMPAELKDFCEQGAELAMAAYDFAISDKNINDIIKLIKAIFNSIPEEQKAMFSDIMPTIPQGLKDYCDTMSYEADLDNLFACVTLFDLGKLLRKSEKESGKSGASLNVDCKLQMVMQLQEYVITEEPEKKTTQALAFVFNLTGGLGFTIKLGENHELKIGGLGGVKDVGFSLTKNVDGCGRVHGITGEGNDAKTIANALAFLTFQRKEDAEPAIWLNSEYLEIRAKNYPFAAYIGYDPFEEWDEESVKKGYTIDEKMLTRLGISLKDKEKIPKGFQAGFIAALEDLEFVLKLRNNKMLAKFLEDDIALTLNTFIGYDKTMGLRIGGGAKLRLVFDLNNKKLGPLHLNTFVIEAGSVDDNIGSFALDIMSAFSVDMNAITISFENLGLGFDCVFLNPATYELMKPDFGIRFKWPSGIGLSVDTAAVKGAGIISINTDEGTFSGALELKIMEKIGVSGFVLCDTGSKPGHYFSLATMICATFSPGIPLGMGFSLTGVGGALGINRAIDTDAVRDGVRQGTMASVFFVSDLKNHLTEVQENAAKFFPAKNKQFYFGILGQISYEPVVKCTFGLMFQLPNPYAIIIVGDLSVSAGESAKDILQINVQFLGAINFEEGLSFDASLVNSKIICLEISGDMAFRLNWGGPAKGFLMSVGGFHPAYKPEEGMKVANMRRLSVGMNIKIVKFSFEAYFAVTSNTFQMGAGFHLVVGWDKFGIVGDAGFDALIQFRPFMFIFGAHVGVAVKLGSMKLLSMNLALDVTAPRPWDVKGTASFKFLFIKINVDFHLKWGKEELSLPEAEISTLDLLLKQADDYNNWVTDGGISDDDVMLLPTEKDTENDDKAQPMIIQPFVGIAFSQNIIPFVTEEEGTNGELQTVFDTMTICNDARPIDYNGYKVENVWVGERPKDKKDFTAPRNTDYEITNGSFAPSLYLPMTPQEKLKSPSYLNWSNGTKLKVKESDNNSGRDLYVQTDHVIGTFEMPTSAASSTRSSVSTRKAAQRVANLSFTETVSEFNAPQASPKDKSATKRYLSNLEERMKMRKGNGLSGDSGSLRTINSAHPTSSSPSEITELKKSMLGSILRGVMEYRRQRSMVGALMYGLLKPASELCDSIMERYASLAEVSRNAMKDKLTQAIGTLTVKELHELSKLEPDIAFAELSSRYDSLTNAIDDTTKPEVSATVGRIVVAILKLYPDADITMLNAIESRLIELLSPLSESQLKAFMRYKPAVVVDQLAEKDDNLNALLKIVSSSNNDGSSSIDTGRKPGDRTTKPKGRGPRNLNS